MYVWPGVSAHDVDPVLIFLVGRPSRHTKLDAYYELNFQCFLCIVSISFTVSTGDDGIYNVASVGL